MQTIRLTTGEAVKVTDEDYPLVSQYLWYYAQGYAIASIRSDGAEKPTRTLMHRLIMRPPAGKVVDHINGDPLDNRRENLRVTTMRMNGRNKARHRDGKSGFKGVCWVRTHKKFVARIVVDGKQKFLGLFDDPQSAADAYDKAAIKYHGEFACTNAKERSAALVKYSPEDEVTA